MSMFPGNPCHKDADFPCPKEKKRKPHPTLDYEEFLFGDEGEEQNAEEGDCR